jgi:hypothetical protein
MQLHFPDVKLIQNRRTLVFQRVIILASNMPMGVHLFSIQIPLSLKILLLKCWLSPKTKDLRIVGWSYRWSREFFCPRVKEVSNTFRPLLKWWGLYKIRPKFEMFGRYYITSAWRQTAKVDILVGAFYVDEATTYRELELWRELLYVFYYRFVI